MMDQDRMKALCSCPSLVLQFLWFAKNWSSIALTEMSAELFCEETCQTWIEQQNVVRSQDSSFQSIIDMEEVARDKEGKTVVLWFSSKTSAQYKSRYPPNGVVA